MLQLTGICKKYTTGELVQTALDNVSLNLRDNEFVAILGPSGSGKTTLLNIIGGLDRYDSGDLVINGTSTKQYTDRDWDSYRNHTIGFVFQSYNLIPHQSVLANVELALTISGVSKAERRRRAIDALKQVGLGDQLHKKPNQMSGGQMQRVAIARALVNNPDILLADEPTGALDTETSLQVMELLKEVAKDRLVVMVTHNPELAEQYATRIVRLQDGVIRSDSAPFEPDTELLPEPVHRNMGKSSMSFLTSLALSFNNLRTKKARTILTAFAGSIGIIGIALILSISTGVNNYVEQIEEETLSEYPVQVLSSGLDMSAMLTALDGMSPSDEEESDQITVTQVISSMFSTLSSNNLAALRDYLESGESGIESYVNAIEYLYGVDPQIYLLDDDSYQKVNPDTLFSSAMGLSSSVMSSWISTNSFFAMPENSSLYEGQYDVVAGRWPENSNECILVLTSSGSISDLVLYVLGLEDYTALEAMVRQFVAGDNVETVSSYDNYSYDDILGITFKLVSSADYYQYDEEYDLWVDKTDDDAYMQALVESGEDLTIVGIVQPAENATSAALSSGINYPASLIAHVSELAESSAIVQAQMADPDTNVFTGEPFGEESDSELDFSSMFSFDEDALQDAFDTSAITDALADSLDLSDAFDLELDTDSLDLTGLVDFSDLSLDMGDLPEMDMSSLMSGLTLNVSAESLSQISTGIMAGYAQYLQENGGADSSDLASDFSLYLTSDAAKSILSEQLIAIMEESGELTVETASVETLLNDILSDYEDFVTDAATSGGDPSTDAYLATGRAQALFDAWVQENISISGGISISDDQMNAIVAALAAGYQTYAAEQDLTTLSSMQESFSAYLASDTANQIMAAGVMSMLASSGLEEQLAAAMQSYMTAVMAAYSESLSTALEEQLTAAMSAAMSEITEQIAASMEDAMSTMMEEMSANLEDSLADAFTIDADALAEAFSFDLDSTDLTELIAAMSSSESTTYAGNLETLGYVDFSTPSEIDIYPIDFDSKDGVIAVLDDYNASQEDEDNVITYTDTVGTMMSSVSTILNVVSYVLIAFVSISLIVSSIMIGIITYISVLERTREIGILRAIGASKRNISQIFNAETLIIGLCAGLLGIGITELLLIPINAIIHAVAGTTDVRAILPIVSALLLVLLSMALTLISGLIPSGKAAKKDPVTALRTE